VLAALVDKVVTAAWAAATASATLPLSAPRSLPDEGNPAPESSSAGPRSVVPAPAPEPAGPSAEGESQGGSGGGGGGGGGRDCSSSSGSGSSSSSAGDSELGLELVAGSRLGDVLRPFRLEELNLRVVEVMVALDMLMRLFAVLGMMHD